MSGVDFTKIESNTKQITAAQFEAIQAHLMSGINLIAQAGVIMPVSIEAGCRMLENAEAELWRALQMYCALPDADAPNL